jgi:nucleoside-diphosphate-sugar epimerase
MAKPYRDRIMQFLEDNYLPDLQANIVAEHVIDPRHFQNTLNSYRGAAFSVKPSLFQSAWLRPHSRSEDLDNLYFVGAGVHPGAGVPSVLASGKIAAEQVVGASVARGLRAVQIRPWNMAGPREAQAKGFVVPRMVAQALAGDHITVFEGGEQERAFTGVWDVCRFITDYLPADYDDWQGQPYNVGAEDNRTTIIALAEVVREVTGSASPIVHTSGKRVFGPRYEEASAGTKLPDASRARQMGWAPETTLTDIVARTAAEQLAPEGVAA